MGKCVGELIVNIGGLRRHLLPTATSRTTLCSLGVRIFSTYVREH